LETIKNNFSKLSSLHNIFNFFGKAGGEARKSLEYYLETIKNNFSKLSSLHNIFNFFGKAGGKVRKSLEDYLACKEASDHKTKQNLQDNAVSRMVDYITSTLRAMTRNTHLNRKK